MKQFLRNDCKRENMLLPSGKTSWYFVTIFQPTLKFTEDSQYHVFPLQNKRKKNDTDKRNVSEEKKIMFSQERVQVLVVHDQRETSGDKFSTFFKVVVAHHDQHELQPSDQGRQIEHSLSCGCIFLKNECYTTQRKRISEILNQPSIVLDKVL